MGALKIHNYNRHNGMDAVLVILLQCTRHASRCVRYIPYLTETLYEDQLKAVLSPVLSAVRILFKLEIHPAVLHEI